MTPTKFAGFTLIELLITLAIAAIVTGFSAPSLSELIDRSRTRQAISDMTQHFAFARTQAIAGGRLVTLCALNADNVCTADWSGPISVFTDLNRNHQLDQQETLLKEFAQVSFGRWTPKPKNKGYFQFTPMGMAHGTLGNITWCPDDLDASKATQLLLNLGGRLRKAQDTNGDGLAEGSDGKPISCS